MIHNVLFILKFQHLHIEKIIQKRYAGSHFIGNINSQKGHSILNNDGDKT
jgi:hypothetical protein